MTKYPLGQDDEKFLDIFNFNNSELAVLRYLVKISEPITAFKLVLKSAIQQPTIYNALNSLMAKRIVEKDIKGFKVLQKPELEKLLKCRVDEFLEKVYYNQ